MPVAPPAPSTDPARRIRRWHTWLVVWRIHRWLGLGFGALLVLLSATGSLLVVHHELEHAFERNLHVASSVPGDRPPGLAETARRLASHAPEGYRLFRVQPAREPGATHKYLFRGPDLSTRWSAFAEPATGRVIWSGPDQSLFTPWLLGLHMHLHVGAAGYWITGMAGLGLALLAGSGLYIHRDRLAQFWRHPFRVHLGWRVAFADLHKWIGVLALYFPVVLGTTGALYCVSTLTVTAPASPAAPFDVAQLAPLEPMITRAREELPGTEVLRVQLPPTAGGSASVLLLDRQAPVWRKFSRVDFDAATGTLRAVRAATDAPLWTQVRSMLAPLHFGFYGAPWVKWAYFAGGLAPAALALSGFALTWARRRSAATVPSTASHGRAP